MIALLITTGVVLAGAGILVAMCWVTSKLEEKQNVDAKWTR